MQNGQTPLEEIKKKALEHYKEASNAIQHYNSFIPQAIKAYQDPNEEMRDYAGIAIRAILVGFFIACVVGIPLLAIKLILRFL